MKAKGGKRPGAGRKSNAQKLLEAGFAAPYFTTEIQNAKWNQLLESKDENIVLKAMQYLTNRLYGMPKQAIEHEGKDGAPISLLVNFVKPNA